MLSRWRDRALLAASIYEELNDKDRLRLEKALDASPELREEAASLKALAEAIPVTRPELDVDLLPGLKRRIQIEAVPAQEERKGSWRLAAFSMASLAVVAVLVFVLYGAIVPAASSPAGGNGVARPASPVLAALNKADALSEQGQFTAAYKVLDAAVSDNPKDAYAGKAQLKLADLSFDELHWYGKAETAYRAYCNSFRTAYTMGSEKERERIAFRLDLLSETRSRNYEPILAVDAALRSGEHTFAKLEGVLAHYQGVYLTALVSRHMANQLEPGADIQSPEYLHALEQAKKRCSEPLALAQLNYEIGAYCYEELDDAPKAREHMKQAAESDNTQVAELARAYLRRIGNASEE